MPQFNQNDGQQLPNDPLGDGGYQQVNDEDLFTPDQELGDAKGQTPRQFVPDMRPTEAREGKIDDLQNSDYNPQAEAEKQARRAREFQSRYDKQQQQLSEMEQRLSDAERHRKIVELLESNPEAALAFVQEKHPGTASIDRKILIEKEIESQYGPQWKKFKDSDDPIEQATWNHISQIIGNRIQPKRFEDYLSGVIDQAASHNSTPQQRPQQPNVPQQKGNNQQAKLKEEIRNAAQNLGISEAEAENVVSGYIADLRNRTSKSVEDVLKEFRDSHGTVANSTGNRATEDPWSKHF